MHFYASYINRICGMNINLKTMANNNYPTNFFHTNEIIHKLVGLWLYNTESASVVRTCFQYSWTFLVYSISLWLLVLEFMIFSETTKDFNKFFGQLGLVFCHTLGIMKVLTLVVQHGRLKDIMDTLQDKHYQYEALGDFKPGDMLTDAKMLIQRVSIMLLGIYSSVGISACITSELMINNEMKEDYFEGNKTCHDFTSFYFRMPFPVDTKTKCEYAFVFMGYCLIVYAWFIACYDLFFAALLNCLKTQLSILREAMKTIRKRVLRRLDLPENFQILHDEDFPQLEEELYNEITHLIKHLIALLGTGKELEAIFNLITLGQTLASLIIFASCLFVAVTVPITSSEFITQLQYFICMILELELFCWFGSGVTRESEEIMFALYDSDWLSASKRYKSSLLTTMSRMQRPIYLSIGKFYPLTLDTIVTVFKGSFSYYTVFKRVNE